MHRRQFIRSGVSPAVLGLAGRNPGVSGSPATNPGAGPSSIVCTYSRDDHRRRLENIAHCSRSIRSCLRRHLITGYLPGQVCYNLGEYPARKVWDPDEWDERELDQLRDQGVRLVQVMEEWNDLLRLFGGDKFRAANPAGLRRFVDMVHKRGMKLLLYASTGFIQATDPDFRQEWARPGRLETAHWNMARCSPASAGWRAYILPRMVRILDDYGADGLYNDFGYLPLYRNPTQKTADEVLAFQESAERDGALEDLLSLIHSEVKRRGGIYKLHQDGVLCPKTSRQLYDYLWVGEGVADVDVVREKVKDHPPYVIPCVDLRLEHKLPSEEERYLNTIPYLQFPLLLAGRPYTGERASVPGVTYYPSRRADRARQIKEYYRTHPEGPFSYGPWDAFPANPESRATYARWLGIYLKLVEEGTQAYLEIRDGTLFSEPLPAGVVASAFAGREVHLVVANYNRSKVSVRTAGEYADAVQRGVTPGKTWAIAPRSLRILRWSGSPRLESEAAVPSQDLRRAASA